MTLKDNDTWEDLGCVYNHFFLFLWTQFLFFASVLLKCIAEQSLLCTWTKSLVFFFSLDIGTSSVQPVFSLRQFLRTKSRCLELGFLCVFWFLKLFHRDFSLQSINLSCFGTSARWGWGVGRDQAPFFQPLIQAAPPRVHEEVADGREFQTQLVWDGELQLFGRTFVLFKYCV